MLHKIWKGGRVDVLLSFLRSNSGGPCSTAEPCETEQLRKRNVMALPEVFSFPRTCSGTLQGPALADARTGSEPGAEL